MSAVSARPAHVRGVSQSGRTFRLHYTAKAAALAACMLALAIPLQSATAAVATSDDLSCAAGYTLAAFAIQNIDGNAAEYYAERAAAAGRRYLQIHPGETERGYQGLVIARARTLQERLALRSLTPETLVNQIARCEQNSDSMIVS